ncbi:MAG: hypothetical protein H0V01_00100 [Bacteroidetes bacterium]|nr:hypothetical protein [Bacteroidota bacterium]HET6244920.1 hypothetical protein [Bacteroidia bacterium]
MEEAKINMLINSRINSTIEVKDELVQKDALIAVISQVNLLIANTFKNLFS